MGGAPRSRHGRGAALATWEGRRARDMGGAPRSRHGKGAALAAWEGQTWDVPGPALQGPPTHRPLKRPPPSDAHRRYRRGHLRQGHVLAILAMLAALRVAAGGSGVALPPAPPGGPHGMRAMDGGCLRRGLRPKDGEEETHERGTDRTTNMGPPKQRPRHEHGTTQPATAPQPWDRTPGEPTWRGDRSGTLHPSTRAHDACGAMTGGHPSPSQTGRDGSAATSPQAHRSCDLPGLQEPPSAAPLAPSRTGST